MIAAGGTAVRGARDREQKAPHRAAAVARGIGAIPGQVAADAGSDEVPAVRDRLKAFTDLAGAGYLMTSGRGAGPAALAARVRGHRETGNRLHRIRDVTDQEDKSLVREGNASRVVGLAAQRGRQRAAPGRRG